LESFEQRELIMRSRLLLALALKKARVASLAFACTENKGKDFLALPKTHAPPPLLRKRKTKNSKMFIPTLLSQADAEQQAQFLPDALSLRIVGTYAQTELGHGTYVRGLETTATYDARTEQFILHTPTLSATKWWPGGLGATATHAVVMARLFCGQGVDRGPHAFVVQVRDMETHRAMPGVKVGDIGPKLGFGSVDNGWLELDHVCIRE
jgi:alkylation response protein AidB-like acyl-CoA dehydrogenase